MVASLGSNHNAARTMRRAVAGAKVPLPRLYHVPVDMLNKKSLPLPKEETIEIPVLLPSDLLSWMYKHQRRQFMRRIVGSDDGSSLERFWSSCRVDDDLVWNHPALDDMAENPARLRSVIPWGNHGDGVPVTRPGAGNASLHVLSSKSLTGSARTNATIDVLPGAPSTSSQ